MPIFEIVIPTIIGFLVVTMIFVFSDRKPPPKQGLQDEVVAVLLELTPEQLEAVNLWAWGAKSGWHVVTLDDYPLMRKRLDENFNRV
jgi:hypothetical protein